MAYEDKNSIDKKTHLIQTAQVLFAQFGLKKVTTDDIAREAHVSKATVYRYFKNKTDVFHAVVHDEADQLLETINKSVATRTKAIDRLKAHLLTRLHEVHQFVNFFRVTQESWGDYWPYIAQVKKDFLSKEKEIVKGILENGVATGELQIYNTDLAAHVLIVALASVEYQWSIDEQDIPLEVLVDTMLEMMIEGIGRRNEFVQTTR